jgi:hypothetical protein
MGLRRDLPRSANPDNSNGKTMMVRRVFDLLLTFPSAAFAPLATRCGSIAKTRPRRGENMARLDRRRRTMQIGKMILPATKICDAGDKPANPRPTEAKPRPPRFAPSGNPGARHGAVPPFDRCGGCRKCVAAGGGMRQFHRWMRPRAKGAVMKIWRIAVLGALLAAGLSGGVPAALAAEPAAPAKPAIEPAAANALMRMGQTLAAKQFSFAARTIRVYTDRNGEFLHVFHQVNVVVDRPNRFLAQSVGDDGTTKFVFDGKTAFVYSPEHNKYAEIVVPGGTIDALMKEAVGRLGVDFPLADFLSPAPNKAFLTGVTTGRVIDTVTIDGAPYLHLFFQQPPGITLELWLSKNDQSLPRRMIVTYSSLPGAPNFIAEFADWNFDVHPPAAEFSFTPPAGAEKVALRASAPAQPAAPTTGAK